MAKGKPKKTPSRIKYEQNHPTVSFRCSKELHEQLEAVKKAEGMSTTDVLKVGVGLLAVNVAKEKDAWKQDYAVGFKKGHEAAKSLYEVTYPCPKCRQPISVTTTQEKEAIKKCLLDAGWGHTECVDR